jgi:ribosomal protein S18 acetylase RimI-like enzyme
VPFVDAHNAPRAYAECWRLICTGISGSLIWESPTVFAGLSRLPSPMMNGVIVTGNADATAVSDAVAAAAVAAKRNVVIDRSGRSAPVDAWLDDQGYDLVQTAPVMVQSDPHPGFRQHSRARIERANTPDAAEAHARVVSRVFNLGIEDVLASMSPANLHRRELSVRIGFLGDEPVSTAMSVVANGVGCVYNVATLGEFQGRGLGRALTETVITDSVAAGAEQIMLQSSEAGLRLYESLGFRTIDEWSNWVSPS